MKTSTTQFALLLSMTVMAACNLTPSPSVQPTNKNTPIPSATVVVTTLGNTSLPDLIVKFVYLEMEGRQSNCVESYTPYEIRVLVQNIGSASAGAFVVDLNSTRQQVEGLAADQVIVLHFAGTIPSGQYEATADPINQVAEREENNNTLSFLAPTPTPPPLCPATSTPTP